MAIATFPHRRTDGPHSLAPIASLAALAVLAVALVVGVQIWNDGDATVNNSPAVTSVESAEIERIFGSPAIVDTPGGHGLGGAVATAVQPVVTEAADAVTRTAVGTTSVLDTPGSTGMSLSAAVGARSLADQAAAVGATNVQNTPGGTSLSAR